MNQITFRPIGIIHTPFTNRNAAPNQAVKGKGSKGTIEIFPEFVEGLQDLEKYSHIILIFNFHLSQDYKLLVKPFMEEKIRGVFATRAPRRPNQIGLSVVELISIEKNILHISDVDIVDGTPLLDIKPFVPEIDCPAGKKTAGWKENQQDSERNFRKSD